MKKTRNAATFLLALEWMLLPIARFCLRHAMHHQDVVEAAKRAFLRASREQLERVGEKENTSRLSALSGLQRKDILRLEEEPEPKIEAYGLVNRLIGQWLYDKRFCLRPGAPRVLTAGTSDSEFSELVSAVSSDLNAGTILFALEQSGSLERTARGVRLRVEVEEVRGDADKALAFLSQDMHDLISAVEHNLKSKAGERLPHALTEFDRIPARCRDDVRRWLMRESTAFQERVRGYLAKLDADVVGRKKSDDGDAEYLRIAFGSFANIEAVPAIRRGHENKD